MKLKEEVDIEVRGEIFMNKATFEKLNELRRKDNLPEFQNPRNAAAGSIRQLDSKIAKERELDIVLYHYMLYNKKLNQNVYTHQHPYIQF